MRYLVSFLLAIVILSVNSFSQVKVCVTTSLISDIVEKIGNENVKVVSLMQPGVDPHLYKAKASDLAKLRSADIIFYNGLHLEGRMIDVLESMARQGKAVYAITDDIERSKLLALDAGTFQGYDPHVWFDPKLWSECAEKIIKELSKIDKVHESQYQLRGEEFKKSLRDTEEWARSKVQEIKEESRLLITSHDAYNYLGRAFGLQVIGVQGVSTASEAGLADIASIVNFIRQRKIKAIFVETSVSPAAIKRISEDSGAVIGGELFSDSLGAKGEKMGKYDVGSYIGMFKYNIETIVNGLK